MRWLEQIENIAAEHGIKVLGISTDRWGHTSLAFFKSPNMEALAKFELEPENIARVTSNHLETKVVISAPETLSFFTQYKKLNQ